MGNRRRPRKKTTRSSKSGAVVRSQAASRSRLPNEEELKALSNWIRHHQWDVKIQAVVLVGEAFNRMGSPFRRMLGVDHRDHEYERIRLGATLEG